MPTIGLSTFLKLCSMNSAQKSKEYGKYLTPGGYDFYWRLKAETTALTTKGKSQVDCKKVIASIKNDVERKHNLIGLNAVSKWVEQENSNGSSFFTPPKGQYVSPRGYVTIKLAPEFGVKRLSAEILVCMWNSKKPDLTQSLADIGNFLLFKHLQSDDASKYQAAILDVRKSKLFVSDAIPFGIEELLADEFEWIDNFFENAPKPSAPGPGIPAVPI